MKTMNKDVLRNLIRHVDGKIVLSSLFINSWESWTGWHKKPGELTYDDTPHTTMKTNDRWDVGYDQTRWFSAKVEIPENMDGEKLYLCLDFGGEGLVRINGKIVGALSNDAGWQYRNYILLDDGVKGKVLDIEVESTVNCGVYCNKAMLGENYLTYTIGETKIISVDKETEQLWFDLTTAYESLDFIDDKVIRDRVYTALDEALHTLDFDFDDEIFYKSVPVSQKLFSEMMSKINDTKQGKIYMVGHSHLDVAWLWTTRELVRKTARTFSNNIALMRKYPDFKFTQSQAIVYDYMKKYYPEVFEEVKEMLKAGKWEIVGNTWVEADTNLASGESLVRQLLYGREFFLKEFGISSDIYWLPDCFGFTWAMPQIIKRSGMKYFYTAKLFYNATNKFPFSTFNWKSHSGDEVVAYVQQAHYEGNYDAGYIKDLWERAEQKDITSKVLGSFGYGDGGGGCTFNMVERSKRFDKMPGIPKAENTFARDFFDGLEDKKDELPTFNDELYYENHRGTFTSQAFIKKNNRKGEFMFRNIEFLNSLAQSTLGCEYPKEKTEEGWKILLTNQFHDILPGTSIHEAVEMTREEYAQMTELGNDLLTSAVKKLNDNIEVSDDGIIVWNMNSMPVSGVVSIDCENKKKIVKSNDGKICKAVCNDGKLSFIAENVPAMGYAVYKTVDGTDTSSAVIATKNLLENSKLKVVFVDNGNIDSIFDKTNNREILTDKGNVLTIFQDKPVHESAWNLEIDYQKKYWNLDKAESVEVVESDSVRGIIRVVRKFNKSVITQDIILAADADYLDFDTTANWNETEKVLKAAFPVNVTSSHATYEIAHGSIERPTHWNYITDLVRFEVCGHKWADLSEGDYGVSLINDCKYGYDIKDNLMRITLMRAPVCPDPVGDKGTNSFVYRLYPHKGVWSQADTVKYAFELNQPLAGYSVKPHNGASEQEKSFIAVDKENVIIDAFKSAQDGRGYIIRMYEANKMRTDVNVKLALGNISKVTECNLMETDENEINSTFDGFNFYITPNQVRTFRVEY